MRDDFGMLILSGGRPDRVITWDTLRRRGYTGRINILCSEDDVTLEGYRQRYGEAVRTFRREDYHGKFDVGSQTNSMRGVTYARNAAWDAAKALGLTWFMALDDDYHSFQYRMFGKRAGDPSLGYRGYQVRNLDTIIDTMIQFMDRTKCDTLCMSQGGDHIGGADGHVDIRLMRKAMNSFLLHVDRRFEFLGRINEDVNAYVRWGNLGRLMFTYFPLQLVQTPTQQNRGGLTEMYLDGGTFWKTFPTVMYMPSAVKVATMGTVARRIHHLIDWDRCVPKIVHERHRKSEAAI